MTKDEALKLALEALESLIFNKPFEYSYTGVISAIEKALAQPEHEPVAWITEWEGQYSSGKILDYIAHTRGGKVEYTPLYTTPPQRTWVGLTADEMETLYQQATYMDDTDHIHMLMMAEAKLKEKNHDSMDT